MKKSTVPAAIVAGLILAAPSAAAAADLAVSGVNLYLIWENSGKLSENLASRDHVTTVSEDGSASQVLMDVVVTGAPDTLYEDVPTLKIAITVTMPMLKNSKRSMLKNSILPPSGV